MWKATNLLYFQVFACLWVGLEFGLNFWLSKERSQPTGAEVPSKPNHPVILWFNLLSCAPVLRAINRQKWLCVLLHPAPEWEFLTLNPKLKRNCLTSVFYYLTFKADKSIFFPLKRNKAIREPGNALSPSQDSHPKACITFSLLLCASLVMWLRDGITGSSVATTQNSRDLSCLPEEENPCVRYINKMTLAWRLKEKFCRGFASITVLK